MAIITFRYNFKVFYTDGGSMEPTIKDGQFVLVNHRYYLNESPQRFDVVIIYDTEDKEYLEKRLVGLPGENLEIKSGAFYINGVELNDPYNNIPKINIFNYGPIKIPKNTYFYIGDDRMDSVWGFVNKKYIKGRVLFH